MHVTSHLLGRGACKPWETLYTIIIITKIYLHTKIYTLVGLYNVRDQKSVIKEDDFWNQILTKKSNDYDKCQLWSVNRPICLVKCLVRLFVFKTSNTLNN